MKQLYLTTRIFAVLLALVLIVPLAIRLFTGGFYMTVQGTSMTPTYQLGDVLLVRPTTPAAVRIGDVVIARFAGTTGTESLYVHRVTAHAPNAWTLRGDHNKLADPVPITDAQLAGKPAFAMTHGLGEVFTFTQNVFGRVFIGCLILLATFWPSIAQWWRATRSTVPGDQASPTVADIATRTGTTPPARSNVDQVHR